MRPFEYARADDAAAAVALVSADPQAQYLAGGTTELDLDLKDAVVEPGRLADVTRLPLRGRCPSRKRHPALPGGQECMARKADQ
jgi:CO/xanthine dehydrogenase FAD-binding subunit